MAAIEVDEKVAARLRAEAEARRLPLSEYLQGLFFAKGPDQSQGLLFETEFRALADQWQRETRRVSSIEKIVLHPAYQKIGMGKEALPLILRELKSTRGHWLWALVMITREDVAKPGQTFRQACDEWVRWGESKGYI